MYKESYVERVSDKGVTGEGTVLYIYDKGVRGGGYRTSSFIICTRIQGRGKIQGGTWKGRVGNLKVEMG